MYWQCDFLGEWMVDLEGGTPPPPGGGFPSPFRGGFWEVDNFIKWLPFRGAGTVGD